MWAITILAGALLAGPASAAEVPPRKKPALRAWLEAGTYRTTYTPEPAAHPSTVAHGPSVRTWYSQTLVADLRAGRPVFSKGAAMVKELLSGDRVSGWAVMRKLRRRSGRTGRGWLFYEALGSTTYFGRGQPLCTGCHRQGTDYLLSAFRPE